MKTLKQLIQDLDNEIQEKGIDNALDLLSPFTKYTGRDWQHHFEPEKNEFQYSIIHQNEHLKLVLIFWNGFRKSEKHGHMKGGGLMRVLSGQVVETRFDPDDEEHVLGTFQYGEGDLCYIHDALAIHAVENQNSKPAISLHLYCKGANSSFGVWEERLSA